MVRTPLYGSGMLIMFFAMWSCQPETTDRIMEFDLEPIQNVAEIPPVPSVDPYGFPVKEYDRDTATIQRNESLYLILRKYDVSPLQIEYIQQAAADHVNLRHMRPGQQYQIYRKEEEAVGMIWNLDRRQYVVLNWEEEPIRVYRDQFDLTVKEQYASGTIESSLFETLQKEGLPPLLGSKIANIYAWEIDFFSLRRGDSFKVIYDELYIGDQFYGIGDVHSAEFYHRGNSHKAYYFSGKEQEGYFDEEGNSLQRALLKAPFEYNQRVSSGFSNNRFHPILKERRPHHGVDYAAPRGTPIIAVGDGRITEARYRGGNGNIVQIRHNSVYRTAYLHMSRFASGIRPGVEVKQGDVIGYVGSTGLATGPHVCYRLYQQDRPVNSLRVELPSSESLAEGNMARFQEIRDRFDAQLAMISLPGEHNDIFSIARPVVETE